MGKIAQYLFVCALLAVTGPVMADSGSTEQGQAAACTACHGPDGNSPALPPQAEQWPKIAGLAPEYIIKQLYDYKSGRRRNGQMSPQAQNIADVDVANIAAFFAAQRVSANPAFDKNLLARGEKLYLKGRNKPSLVIACAGCHGKKGAGQRNRADKPKIAPAMLAPAIGGQHARYVVKQLKAFQEGIRTNDVGRVMYNSVLHLDDEDIVAVAEYVATLVY